jgi:hypothetical protein
MEPDPARRRTHLRCAVAVLLVALGCASSGSSDTGVVVSVVAERGLPAIAALSLSWLEPTGFAFRDTRVEAAQGAAPGTPLATIRISVDRAAAGRRWAITRGLDGGGTVIAEGYGAIDVAAGTWLPLTVTLHAGRLPDRDGDGIPDEIKPGPTPVAPDAAASGDAPPETRVGPETTPPDGPPAAADRPDAAAPAVEAGPDLRDAPGVETVPDLPPDRAPECNAVILSDASPAAAGDMVVRARLEMLGCTATIVPAANATSGALS